MPLARRTKREESVRGDVPLTDTWLKSGVPEATLNAWTDKLDAAEKHGVAAHIEILKPMPEPPPAAPAKRPKTGKVLTTLAALPEPLAVAAYNAPNRKRSEPSGSGLFFCVFG